jgi:hypothetical protein
VPYTNPEDVDPDLDDLTRAELAELGGAPPVVAQVLDEWNQRHTGITSSSHGVGLFLDLLGAEGYRVTPIEAPDIGTLLPNLHRWGVARVDAAAW